MELRTIPLFSGHHVLAPTEGPNTTGQWTCDGMTAQQWYHAGSQGNDQAWHIAAALAKLNIITEPDDESDEAEE